MIKQRLTRRQFFKASAIGTGVLALPTIGLASVAAAPSREAQAGAEQPEGPAIIQPTFNSIASNTTFGPLTDISMGWDGTVWGIDAQGAPHVYDPINEVWAQHGEGIDAAAWMLSTNVAYLFKGDQLVTVSPSTMQASAPQPIGTVWPNLPDSFKLGVVGAGGLITGGLMLFNSGRYVTTDNSIPAGKLVNLPGWPQTPNWKDGVIDGVINSTFSKFVLMRMGEAVEVDMLLRRVTGPAPLNQVIDTAALPASWATGFDAATLTQLTPTNPFWLFKGTAVAVMSDSSATAQLQYLGNLVSNWPATWHPVLQHAPNGRDGNLWSVLPSTQGSWIVQHNGDTWTKVNNQADHVGVGQDNAVMIASAQRLWKFTGAIDGTGFTPVSQPNNLIQVSLGNANAVFARDTGGNVYSFDPSSNSLTQNTAVGAAAHIATTNDGTLWHAKPSDANLHRFLSNANVLQGGIPVSQGIVRTVQKVAATGFGTAHCLTQDGQGNTQAYRYDSPYVFQTQKSYLQGSFDGAWIEQGLGLLYLVDNVDVDNNPVQPTYRTQVVALDAHTGVEVARTPVLAAPSEYNQPVFDPVHNLVYVGTTPLNEFVNNTTQGQLLALDARTLAVTWAFTAQAGIDAPPALKGTRLCFGDRTGTLYMFDTSAALTNAANPAPLWTWQLPVMQAQTHRISTPTFVTDDTVNVDLIYMTVWDWTDLTDPQTSAQISWAQSAVNSSNYRGFNSLHSLGAGGTLIDYSTSWLGAPAHGKVNIAPSDSAQQLSPALYYICGDAVIGVGAGPTAVTFTLPGDRVSTGLTYDAEQDQVWFGGYNGTLYCLSTNLTPVNHTPYPPDQSGSIVRTTPVRYKDTKGDTTVLFNVFHDNDPSSANLMGFDPDNGNIASVPTGATILTALSKAAPNGVIYCYGSVTANASGGRPQAFGIRVDDLLQAERDFIIESQLMQDPQDPGGAGGSTVTSPDGNVIPPSVARYQTHLTVVDDQKTPQANEAVKIWADVDGTVITVNGTQYTIGPADSAFASVTTGVDGALVITSDATDVNASALRVWASFMDPYERIVVYPDQEWHGRAAQSNANGTVADPAKPNLNTAYSYKPDPNVPGSTTPKPLFTSDEVTQGTPTNVANAVGQMNTGLNPGGSSPASVAGALKTLNGSNPAAPYIAYTDLGGMHYGPNNARVTRPAAIATPIGFALTKPKGGTHTFTPLSHSDARNQIDALTGTAWDPKNPNAPLPPSNATSAAPATFVIRRADNIFTDFWNWLVGAINTVVQAIENIVVSVAEDIAVGIKFIVDGVEKVFKVIIKVIEDVCNAIGSFFIQLAKLIEEVIEALSVLFHFGEIMNTHRWMRDQINSNLQATVAAMQNQVQPAVDAFLGQGEQTIEDLFHGIRQSLGINDDAQVNDLSNARSTPHSAYTVGPGGVGPTSGGTSQAVQCGHGTQKMKEGLPSAQATTSLIKSALITGFVESPTLSPDDDNELSAFMTNFVNSLDNGPGVKAAFSSLTSAINNIGQSQSAGDFFKGALNLLLTIVEDLILGMVALTKALMDGLIGAIQALINATLELLNTPIDIPFFSWLYKLLFNEDLTILNAVTLVAAIPVTIIYRVATGNYPSQDGITGTQASMSMQRQNSPSPVVINKMQGTIGGVIALALGVVRGVVDLAGATPPRIGTIFVLTFGLCYVATYYPLMIPGSTANAMQWAAWGLGVALATLGTFGVINLNGASPVVQTRVKGLLTFLRVSLAIARFVVYVVSFVTAKNTQVMSDLTFARNLFLELPPMFNWLKLLGNETANIVLTVIDAVTGVVVCVLDLALAWVKSDPEPRSRQLHLPWIAFNPAVVRTQPQPLSLGGATP